MALHFHKLTVKDIRRETADCISIAFDIPAILAKDFEFKQGQSINVRIVNNGEEIRRSYSICTSPLEKELRIGVKKVTDGIFSTYANTILKKGDEIEVMTPSGKFYTEINPLHKKSYLAFAAGSGITPIISIIKTVLFSEPESSFTLVYGNRHISSIIFREELEALKNKYMDRFRMINILSREKTDAEITYGRIDKNKCRQLEAVIDISACDEFFLCGPESMIFSVKEYLEEKGISPKNIHFELFTTPLRAEAGFKKFAEKEPIKDTSHITVKADGRTFEFNLDYDSNTILDAALAEGADLPFACKGGVCTTCKAKLVSGEVEMEVNYGLEPDEVEAGFILTCQSHPRTGEVVVDYDVK